MRSAGTISPLRSVRSPSERRPRPMAPGVRSRQDLDENEGQPAEQLCRHCLRRRIRRRTQAVYRPVTSYRDCRAVGLQLSIGLDRMKERYGTPSEDQIAPSSLTAAHRTAARAQHREGPPALLGRRLRVERPPGCTQGRGSRSQRPVRARRGHLPSRDRRYLRRLPRPPRSPLRAQGAGPSGRTGPSSPQKWQGTQFSTSASPTATGHRRSCGRRATGSRCPRCQEW